MRGSRLVVLLFLLLLGVGVGTYLAGEQTEVVVLRTFGPPGVPHETKLWVVDHDGVPWVRVANPHRRWFARLRDDPRAELVRGGKTRAVLATPDDSPAARAELDRAFREKYGAVDWWYGLLLRRDPIPVRLDPEPQAPPAP